MEPAGPVGARWACATTKDGLVDAAWPSADSLAWARAGRHPATIAHQLSAVTAMTRNARPLIDDLARRMGSARDGNLAVAFALVTRSIRDPPAWNANRWPFGASWRRTPSQLSSWAASSLLPDLCYLLLQPRIFDER